MEHAGGVTPISSNRFAFASRSRSATTSFVRRSYVVLAAPRSPERTTIIAVPPPEGMHFSHTVDHHDRSGSVALQPVPHENLFLEPVNKTAPRRPAPAPRTRRDDPRPVGR